MYIPTISDIIISLFLAFIILFIIKLFTAKSFDKEFIYPLKEDPKTVINTFYKLFPKKDITFKGKVYKRGMHIELITNNEIIEGIFIGQNSKELLCILTKEYFITNKFNNIIEINLIENN